MESRVGFGYGESLPNIEEVSFREAISGLGRAAYTLFVTPRHEKLHQVVESAAVNLPSQPMQPSVEYLTSKIDEDVLIKAEVGKSPKFDTKQLMYFGGVLIQFSDFVPQYRRTMEVSYSGVEELHEAVIDRATGAQPLNYAEQLDTALGLTEGDLPKSLWRLFTTSRLYARWLDEGMVRDVPNLTSEEKVAKMLEWRRSIAACKNPIEGKPQDPNGDTYYTWTHALAKYVYSLAPERESSLTHGMRNVFHNGTTIMHKAVHTFNKQGVNSDHSVAAQYGNAIGQVCVDYAQQDRIGSV